MHPIRGTAGTARGASTVRSNEWLDVGARTQLVAICFGNHFSIDENAIVIRAKVRKE